MLKVGKFQAKVTLGLVKCWGTDTGHTLGKVDVLVTNWLWLSDTTSFSNRPSLG